MGRRERDESRRCAEQSSGCWCTERRPNPIQKERAHRKLIYMIRRWAEERKGEKRTFHEALVAFLGHSFPTEMDWSDSLGSEDPPALIPTRYSNLVEVLELAKVFLGLQRGR